MHHAPVVIAKKGETLHAKLEAVHVGAKNMVKLVIK